MSIILWQLVGSGMGIPAAIVALLYIVSHYKMIFRNIASVLSETTVLLGMTRPNTVGQTQVVLNST
jgi:hypothetical protein